MKNDTSNEVNQAAGANQAAGNEYSFYGDSYYQGLNPLCVS